MDAGTIESEHDGGVVVLTLRGEHDVATAPLLRETLRWWSWCGSTVIVDLSLVEFLDSSVLQVLVTAQRNRQLIAVAAPSGGAASRLFDLVRLGEAIPTYQTRAEAVARAGDTPDYVETSPPRWSAAEADSTDPEIAISSPTSSTQRSLRPGLAPELAEQSDGAAADGLVDDALAEAAPPDGSSVRGDAGEAEEGAG